MLLMLDILKELLIQDLPRYQVIKEKNSLGSYDLLRVQWIPKQKGGSQQWFS